MKQNLPTLTRIKMGKPENFIGIINKKINEKPFNLIQTKEENQS